MSVHLPTPNTMSLIDRKNLEPAPPSYLSLTLCLYPSLQTEFSISHTLSPSPFLPLFLSRSLALSPPSLFPPSLSFWVIETSPNTTHQEQQWPRVVMSSSLTGSYCTCAMWVNMWGHTLTLDPWCHREHGSTHTHAYTHAHACRHTRTGTTAVLLHDRAPDSIGQRVWCLGKQGVEGFSQWSFWEFQWEA